MCLHGRKATVLIVKNLDYMVARLANKLPPSFTLLDGIYTTERGPFFEGRLRRSNLLIASSDIFSGDKVGARVLGYDPSEVPHLVYPALDLKRPIDLHNRDLSNIEEFRATQTDPAVEPVDIEVLRNNYYNNLWAARHGYYYSSPTTQTDPVVEPVIDIEVPQNLILDRNYFHPGR